MSILSASKRRNTSNITEGSLWRGILSFAFPLVLTGILNLLYTSADMAVVGQFDGPAAVGAVGSTGSLVVLFTNLVIGFSTGASICVANRLGARADKEATEFVHTAIATALVSGCLLALVGFWLTPTMLSLINTEPTYFEDAVLYLRIVFCGFPVQTLYNFSSAIIRTTGDTRRPFLYLAASGMLNVALNVILVAVFHLGVAGVAIATVIAQLLSAILTIRHMVRIFPKEHPCHLSLRGLRFYKPRFMLILSYGIPIALQSSMFSISNVLLQSTVNSFGPEAVSGNAAAANLSNYTYTCMSAFSQTTSVFVGQNVGAGKRGRVKSTICLACLFSSILALAVACLTLFFSEPLLSIFIPGERIAMLFAEQRFYYLVGPYFLCGIMDIFSFAARAMGSKAYPLIVSVVGVCGFRVLWIFAVLPFLRGFFPDSIYIQFGMLFLSYPVSWIITGAFQIGGIIFRFKRLPREGEASANTLS